MKNAGVSIFGFVFLITVADKGEYVINVFCLEFRSWAACVFCFVLFWTVSVCGDDEMGPAGSKSSNVVRELKLDVGLFRYALYADLDFLNN